MSSGSAMVTTATAGNSLQTMYDTSCSYQTALELKRMSCGGGMTGVTGPMTSSVGMHPFGIKTEVECNGNDWTTGCTYRIPAIPCSGMSTFEQLKQSVEKAKAVLNAEAVVTRDSRNYFSASFSALPNMGMGMNFAPPPSATNHPHHQHHSANSISDRSGSSLLSSSVSSNDIGAASSRADLTSLTMSDLSPVHSSSSLHHHTHHHHHHSLQALNNSLSLSDERLCGGGVGGDGRGIVDNGSSASEKRTGQNSSNNSGLTSNHRQNNKSSISSSSPIHSIGVECSSPSSTTTGVKGSYHNNNNNNSSITSSSSATTNNTGASIDSHNLSTPNNINNNNSNHGSSNNSNGGRTLSSSVSGIKSGGGHGLMSRSYGLTADSIIEMELVDASGKVLIVNDNSNRDLFWALRGAGGGSFGIVTRFTFSLIDAPGSVIFCKLTYDYPSGFPAVFAAWQALFASNPPKSLNSNFAVRNNTITLQFVEYVEALNGSIRYLEEIVANFPPPLSIWLESLTFQEFLEINAGPMNLTDQEKIAPALTHGQAQDRWPERYLKSTSMYVNVTLELSDIQVFHSLLTSLGPSSYFYMVAYGGAINNLGPQDTAFVHRGGNVLYMIEVAQSTSEPDPDEVARLRSVFERTKSLINHTQSYQNYVDEDLEDYLQRYYGSNLERLVQVKALVDPDDYFNNPQSIPTDLGIVPGSVAVRAGICLGTLMLLVSVLMIF